MLIAVYIVIGIVIGLIFGLIISLNIFFNKRVMAKVKNNEDKFKKYYYLLNQWIKKINKDKKIENYFETNNIKSIAIYGIGELGLRLYEQIKQTNIRVEMFIESNILEASMYDSILVGNFDIFKKQTNIEAIVVSPIYDFALIHDTIRDSGYTGMIISLDDIIFDM